MSPLDAIRLVRKRGLLMQNTIPAGEGAMCAVLGMETPVIETVLSGVDGVTIANYNCPGQLVITGRTAAVETAAEKLKQRHERPVSLCAKTERRPVSRPRSQVRRIQRIHALYKLPIYESECGRYNKYRYEFPPDGTQNDNGGTEHGRKRTRTRGT